MTDRPDAANRLKCSFCGKQNEQVLKLIAGPGVYICNECVDLCNEILGEEKISQPAQPPGEIDAFKQARRDILQAALQTEPWIIKRVASESTGIGIFVQGRQLGTTIEEKVLFLAAFDDLANGMSLSKCGEEAYQVTWWGLLESRRDALACRVDLASQFKLDEHAKEIRKLGLKTDKNSKSNSPSHTNNEPAS